MATTTKTVRKSDTLASLLEQAPRIARLLETPGTIYFGVCIVQAPGAWSRVGPTWRVPGVGVVVIGPGIARWGTTAGLAQLAGAGVATAKPEWHAVGLAICEPNLMFAVTASALAAPQMAEVTALAAEVDHAPGT